jgi:hypothetical protein
VRAGPALCTSLLGVLPAALLAAPLPGAAGDVATTHVWSYDAATHRLVGSAGELPFTVKGGSAVTAEGAPAVKFTISPSLATYTGTDFPAPGAQDFRWTAVMSMDRLNKRSTPNVAQFGLYSGPQIKMQLDRQGRPQCVFNGTNGRGIITAATTVNDGGRRHVFSCWRTGATLGVTVDSASSTTTFDVGAVTPNGQPTVGNRTATGGAKDQLFGKFWSLTVTTGQG